MAYAFKQGVDIPKDPESGALPTLSVEHAEVHAGRSFELSLILTVLNADYGAVQMSIPAAAAAAVTVDLTNANADVTYTANTIGSGGNDITVTHVDPEDASQALSVTRSGNAITINLATNAESAITSTSAEVAAAVNADAEIARVLTATAEGTGAGVVVAKAAENLAGGVDVVDVHFKAASVSVTKGEMTAIFKEDASFVAAGTALTPVNRNRQSSNTSQLLCKSNADTTVVDGAKMVSLFTTLLGAASVGNQRISGETGQGEELQLKQGANYLLQILNSSGTTEKQSFQIEWYERATDRFKGF